MAEEGRPVGLGWAVAAAAFLVLVTVALVVGGSREQPQPRTSYDPSDRGFRAAYLLLEELHYPVNRSRTPAGGEVRWLLFPGPAPRYTPQLDAWLRQGGRLLLAGDDRDFAAALGIKLTVSRGDETDEEVSGAVRGRLRGGETKVEAGGGRVWAWVGREPLVSIHRRGGGEVWLVHRPEFLTNRLLKEDDNGLVLCRLAEAMLEDRPGDIGFDEFFHGLRERPGVTRLLLTPPTVWVTVEALLLLVLVLWRNTPRFGPLRPPAALTRRSKEEYLDAVAVLLQRKGDHAESYRSARDALKRELERELGLPPDSEPALVAAEAARYRGVSQQRLLRLLDSERPPEGAGPPAFVNALKELEAVRDECLARQRH